MAQFVLVNTDLIPERIMVNVFFSKLNISYFVAHKYCAVEQRKCQVLKQIILLLSMVHD